MLAFPMKVLYFILGLAAAGGTIAYGTGLFDRYLAPETEVAETPTPAGKVARLDPPASPASPNAPAAPPAKAAADIVAPRFDLLRVEPDGSLLIAGTAAAEASIEVVSGTKVLAKTMSSAIGEFVAVLENRLAPGDYQIVLRSTTADNVVATSMETAVVSIPESKAGQVLAIVEQPGAPSRLITVPEGEKPPAATAEAETAAKPDGAPQQAAEQPQQPKTAPAPAAVAEQPSAPAVAANEAGEKPAAPAPAQPGAQDAAAAPAQTPPASGAAPTQPGGQDMAAAPAQTPPASGAAPGPGASAPPSTPATPESRVRVMVEAVEIEGRKIFIAGTAEPDRYVRAYANELLLGESKVAPNGRFLVEAERDIPVGDYIIRVDMLGDNRSTVIARAAVPFQREAGENIAAVAPRPKAPAPAAEAPAAPAVPASPATPAAPVQTPPAGADLAGQPAATPPADAGQAPSEQAAAPDKAEKPDLAAAPSQPATPPSAEAGVVMSPPLQRADSAVIIRRGDTLWRISRRVYGKGIRYSTIYLANQDQIEDPDRIWPGQIFAMPGESADGTTANWDALGGQLTEKSNVN